MTHSTKEHDKDRNPDPITGAPGSHPVGTGVGAAAGGVGGMAAGAAIGAALSGPAAPIGAVVGAAAGAIAGGLAGKGVAEKIDPTVEDEYWRAHHVDRPYADRSFDYDADYRPAYTYGWESRTRYPDRQFDDVETDLERGWERAKGRSRLSWEQAKMASRDAWHRVEHAMPGDFDRDGR